MMKRWFAIAMACMLLLTGCGGKGSDTSGKPSKAPAVSETVNESKALADFREEIADETATLAVAYLGYADLTGFDDLTVYLESSGFYELYPFLNDLTKEQFLQREGGELYAVVPTSAKTTLTVHDCYVDEVNYVMAQGEELLKLEPGQPVILQGNVSEIVPNLWVVAEQSGKEPLEFVPCLNMMDGTLSVISGVYDFSDYEILATLWKGPQEVSSDLCGIWYGQEMDGDGVLRALTLTLWEDYTAEYSYGDPYSEVLESFGGYWSEESGLLMLDLSGGPVDEYGVVMEDYAYTTDPSFAWKYNGQQLCLEHVDGYSLLYGTEGQTIELMPFDAHLLAGCWTASAPYQSWDYEMTLQNDGQSRFSMFENGEQLAGYEGWWSMTEDGYVTLGMELKQGQHPESREIDYISGTYLAENYGGSMQFSFVSGDILTINMEESGSETFAATAAGGSCVSVHYAEDMSFDPYDYDWVTVDDNDPCVRVTFCTTAPVANFNVVSLFLKDYRDDGTMDFEVTPVYEYGALEPDCPLTAVLAFYGDLPSYGVSFTDPNGEYRLFGVTMSGEDGSLELMEIQ